MKILFVISAFLFLFINAGSAQKHTKDHHIYVDASGVMRYTKGNAEASFFGVNYTLPFAFGYRAAKRLQLDHEKEIDKDVYHFARLGLNAFRVHVWDTEITDSAGNLKENEHLRLFDYLVFKLKERKMKIFLTPLAFWGNGYPERDEHTGSFSSKWNKQQVLVTEEAIRAQEVYLSQFLKHVNPYTRQTYGDDPDIIALEINNEPHHNGTLQQAADYISRMIRSVKSAGWTKPVFYNISESPRYASAVANAAIEGVSFQWYPTGLVANRSLEGNFLPNVDRYVIPFDTIPAYKNKARMVYEFDAGDVPGSYMYPAMARSFRTAGFQWVTQFAYDPLSTAPVNTEYQTHYLNLAYTPSKAISLLIAGRAFRQLPRLKSYGSFPQDTIFDVFRVSYINNLSEMNSTEAFYYSNATGTKPVNTEKLKHIGGVGTSPVVAYTGSGAYFIDRIHSGTWRLEVMPDVVSLGDPFERTSPGKQVAAIEWLEQTVRIQLPDLGEAYFVRGVNKGNHFRGRSIGSTIRIRPGVYLLSRQESVALPENFTVPELEIKLPEFIAPAAGDKNVRLIHQPVPFIKSGTSHVISALLTRPDSLESINLELEHSMNIWKTIPMSVKGSHQVIGAIPADMMQPGLLRYRILVQQKGKSMLVFPGEHTGDPYAWGNYSDEKWQTFITGAGDPLYLYHPAADRNALMIYNPNWRTHHTGYPAANIPGQLLLKATIDEASGSTFMGWQLYVGKKIHADHSHQYNALTVQARSAISSQQIKIKLITKDGDAFGTTLTTDTVMMNYLIPLSSLQPDSSLLLPRPYPGFLPMWFRSSSMGSLQMTNVDKLEILFLPRWGDQRKPSTIELGSVMLVK